MKKLFIGCRVRILYSDSWPELAGEEGRVVSRVTGGGITGREEWHVAPDRWGSEHAPTLGRLGGTRFSPNSDQLEPILPDGHQASTMSHEELMTSLRTQTQEEPA